jgi:hypothetical protein
LKGAGHAIADLFESPSLKLKKAGFLADLKPSSSDVLDEWDSRRFDESSDIRSGLERGFEGFGIDPEEERWDEGLR